MDVLSYLFGASVMVMAGLGVLRLLRLDDDPITAAALAPMVTQAAWANALGFGVAGRVPVHALAGPIWIATGAAALFGCWSWYRRRGWTFRGANGSAGGSVLSMMLGICFLLPLILLLPYVVYGFSDYPGSRFPDGWSYAAYGQYLWALPRGAEGWLSPVYQYASHLATGRHVGSAQLALLSVLTPSRDTQAATGLFLALGFFSYTAACVAFARSRGLSVLATLWFVLLAVLSGWSLNLLLANNYDNLLALTFCPGIAAVASTVRTDRFGSWLLAGVLASGVIYTYPELGLVVCGISLVMLGQRLWRSGESVTFLHVAFAVSVVLFLLSPYLTAIFAFLANQSAAALQTEQRPGSEFFTGLLMGWSFPSAFWALGGEHRYLGLLLLRTVVASVLFVVLAVGVIRQVWSRDWGTVAALSLPLFAAPAIILGQAYSYAAYKMILTGWWAVAFTLVSGAKSTTGSPIWRRAAASIVVTAGLAIPVFAGARIAREIWIHQPTRMNQFRVVEQVSRFTGGEAVGIFVEDWEASQWAVYFLRDQPIKLGIYLQYLATPQVHKPLERATPIEWSDVRYLLTDAVDPGPVIENQGGRLVWRDGSYRLWAIGDRSWAIVTDASTPNGFERVDGEPFFWMGGGSTRLQLLTKEAGCLDLDADVVPVPNRPKSEISDIKLELSSGIARILQFAPGPNRFRLRVVGGASEITLTPVSAGAPLNMNGDTRPAVAGVWRLTTNFEPAPPRPSSAVTTIGTVTHNGELLAFAPGGTPVEDAISVVCQ